MTVGELIDRFQEAWTGKRRAAFHDCCTLDVHYEDPLCERPLEGPDDVADHAARLWRVRAFYDLYDAGVQLGLLPRRGTLGERALLMLRGFGLRT